MRRIMRKMPNLQTLLKNPSRSAQMQAVVDWLAVAAKDFTYELKDTPQFARRQQAKVYALWQSNLPEVPSTRVSAPGIRGAPEVICDWIVPPNARKGALVYAHGGGWVMGDLASHGRLVRLLALKSGFPVLNVQYRLAPEHSYPEPLNDVRAAYRWLLASGHAEGGPVFIGGDSAGANLALATCLAEAEVGRKAPDGGLLFYGGFYGDMETPSAQALGDGFGLTQDWMKWYYKLYLADVEHSDPLAAPLQASEANLAKLPPFYINAAGLDPLLCDSLDLAKRLDEAGTEFELSVVEGVQHGFMIMDERLDVATREIEAAAQFLIKLAGKF